MDPAETVCDEAFFSIAIESLDLIDKAPCDLFRYNQNGEYVLFAARQSRIDRQVVDRMASFGVAQLYVRTEDSVCFSQMLRARLDQLVNDPNVTAEEKARAVHLACRDVMRRAFDDPRGPFIRQAGEIIEPTVDLIVKNDEAARCLVRLTSFDQATYIHSTNVGIFSLALARLFFGGDRSHDMHRLGTGFFLHDLGKCRVPIEIINKPGPLTPEERQVINRHVEEGYRILDENRALTPEARTIILEHHEKDNGKGYPHGKQGNQIHPYARICRLADIYEALTAERPYHQRRTTFEALKIMKEQEVADVDRELFSHFVGMFT